MEGKDGGWILHRNLDGAMQMWTKAHAQKSNVVVADHNYVVVLFVAQN